MTPGKTQREILIYQFLYLELDTTSPVTDEKQEEIPIETQDSESTEEPKLKRKRSSRKKRFLIENFNSLIRNFKTEHQKQTRKERKECSRKRKQG